MKITPKEFLKKPVIPAGPAPYRDTGDEPEEPFKKSVIPAKAGIQGLKNRGKSSADWMPAPVSLIYSWPWLDTFCEQTLRVLPAYPFSVRPECRAVRGVSRDSRKTLATNGINQRLASVFAGLVEWLCRANQRFPDFSSFPRLVLLAFALLPAVAAAEEAAVNSAVNSLGRLFYTPEQRIQLERLRSRPGETGMTISNTISVNGIVQRRGGGSVVWINGVPQSHESDDGLLAGRNIAPDSAPVKVPGAHKPVRLKVGQSIDINSGAVSNIGTAPATGKDVPARENEQARQAGQADAPLQRPAPGGRVKSAPLTEKDD